MLKNALRLPREAECNRAGRPSAARISGLNPTVIICANLDAMKTNETIPRAPLACGAAPSPRHWLRLVAIMICSILAVVAAPIAAAAPPDGTYKFVTASGSLTLGGDTVELTPDMIRELGIVNDVAVTVRNQKVALNRKAIVKLLKKVEKELGAKVETSISGPTSVTLRKKGKGWTGKTAKPVVVKFSITYQGQTAQGVLRTHFVVNVVGKNLTMKTPITGKVLGQNLSAQAVAKFKR